MIIKIRVIPRSAKSEIIGAMADGTLKIKLKSPPVDGRANEELVELLSEEYRVPRSSVRIVKGMKGKSKAVQIDC